MCQQAKASSQIDNQESISVILSCVSLSLTALPRFTYNSSARFNSTLKQLYTTCLKTKRPKTFCYARHLASFNTFLLLKNHYSKPTTDFNTDKFTKSISINHVSLPHNPGFPYYGLHSERFILRPLQNLVHS